MPPRAALTQAEDGPLDHVGTIPLDSAITSCDAHHSHGGTPLVGEQAQAYRVQRRRGTIQAETSPNTGSQSRPTSRCSHKQLIPSKFERSWQRSHKQLIPGEFKRSGQPTAVGEVKLKAAPPSSRRGRAAQSTSHGKESPQPLWGRPHELPPPEPLPCSSESTQPSQTEGSSVPVAQTAAQTHNVVLVDSVDIGATAEPQRGSAVQIV